MPVDLATLRGNRLLATLPRDDTDVIRPRLERVPLEKNATMERPGTAIEHVYFPLAGLGSVVAVGSRAKDQRVETRIFGRDGMSGISIVMGADRAPYEVYVQVAGVGLRMASGDLVGLMDERPAIRALLLRYAQAAHVQTSYTALANGRDKLETRLARWILMAHDRLDGDEIGLTHEFLALMLGVRRAGVTVATHSLEGRGLIRAARGTITVLDRDGLDQVADGSYGVAEAEYERLIGRPV